MQDQGEWWLPEAMEKIGQGVFSVHTGIKQKSLGDALAAAESMHDRFGCDGAGYWVVMVPN